jgi:hypothetical protein
MTFMDLENQEKAKLIKVRILTKVDIHGFGNSGKSRVSSQRHILTS